jgi:hypothetical protein
MCAFETNLEPMFDDEGKVIEDIELYCKRTRDLLPNLPNQVIKQWLYEHPESWSRYSWLIFSILHFDLTEVEWNTLNLDCFKNEPYVQLHLARLIENRSDERAKIIKTYFSRTGTWPVPPIVLSNHDGKIKYPDGMECSRPYHLIEGRHRFAVLFYLDSIAFNYGPHKIWLASMN